MSGGLGDYHATVYIELFIVLIMIMIMR